jgi:hypothetical protein
MTFSPINRVSFLKHILSSKFTPQSIKTRKLVDNIKPLVVTRRFSRSLLRCGSQACRNIKEVRDELYNYPGFVVRRRRRASIVLATKELSKVVF